MSKLHLPLKWHGGKRYLADAILARMPRHMHYVEPFAGGLAVLLARDPDDPRFWWGQSGQERGVSEIVNDLDGHLANFWRVLADPERFPEFFRQVNMTPFSRQRFEDAEFHENDSVRDAVSFFVQCRQSRSGMRQGFTPLTRNRTRRGMNGNVSEWLGAVDGLPDLHQRLRRVVVENMDAIALIRREDTPHTFFYCDPPYLHETRVSKDAYAVEMTTVQHLELLGVLSAIRGKFMLSGYPSNMYQSACLNYGWQRVDIDIANHAAGGESKRRMTECLWMNYKAAE